MENLQQIFTPEMLRFIAALTLLMIGNVATGVINAQEQVSFDWKKLGNGAFKYFLFLLAYICGVIATTLFSDITINVNGEEVTLLMAIEGVKTAILTLYGGKFIQNIIQYFHLCKEELNKEPTIKESEIVAEEQIIEEKAEA